MQKKIKNLKKKSLLYHKLPSAGKISIKVTKKLKNRKDLSLAYSPGVAEACIKIKKKYKNIYKYTIKGNLIGIITNGTAVLGLGNIGPGASKPVMEGKSALFKKFSNINAFDIEIDEKDPDKLCNIIKSLEHTFGGINLEDIKSPECFFIEKKLKNIMNIPIFHDDQHGTAVVVCAAFLN
uniref:Malic enzyme N-terminal domain-containing protein n=1 Tax=Clastoptera arizonana TaxID=38151 RepID=A0A1B6D185_9HEMI